MRPVQFLFTALATSLTLAACGASTTQAPTALATTAVPLAPTAALAAATITLVPASASTSAPAVAVPTAVPAATVVAPKPSAQAQENPLVARVRMALLTQPNLGQQTLNLQNMKQVDWPNSALGCPVAGKVYLQVITPGFQITFSDGARIYDVHTNTEGDPLIWCDSDKPKVISASK